jgi:hypothetical protein
MCQRRGAQPEGAKTRWNREMRDGIAARGSRSRAVFGLGDPNLGRSLPGARQPGLGVFSGGARRRRGENT